MIARIAFAAGLVVVAAAKAEEAPRTAYAPQKVVYQVNAEGGLMSREYRRILAVAANHVNALPEGQLDLRIVLQGEGVGVLREAVGDERLRGQVDWLKARKVRFLICRNTLTSQKLEATRDLYGAREADVVPAGVAEIAALEQQGFVYIRP